MEGRKRKTGGGIGGEVETVGEGSGRESVEEGREEGVEGTRETQVREVGVVGGSNQRVDRRECLVVYRRPEGGSSQSVGTPSSQ